MYFNVVGESPDGRVGIGVEGKAVGGGKGVVLAGRLVTGADVLTIAVPTAAVAGLTSISDGVRMS